jgi:hypothetical protein
VGRKSLQSLYVAKVPRPVEAVADADSQPKAAEQPAGIRIMSLIQLDSQCGGVEDQDPPTTTHPVILVIWA